MKASLIEPHNLSAESVMGINQPLDRHDLLAEMLRNELAACIVWSRRSLCMKVIKLIEPLQQVEIEEAKEILSELEMNGDITKGPSGQTAAAPLRAIRLSVKSYRLIGCISTSTLEQTFPEAEISYGLKRYLNENIDEGFLLKKIETLGGILISPERWSGLSRSPDADEEWLSSLTRIDEEKRISAGGLDDGIIQGWQGYKADEREKSQSERWKRGVEDGKSRLWRGWHERGWYVYAWTAGKTPTDEPCVKLNSDQARRTMFALDRMADNPLSAVVTQDSGVIQCRILGFLPVAEYRYLSTIGEYTGRQRGSVCFEIPKDTWLDASKMLNSRLGIKIDRGKL